MAIEKGKLQLEKYKVDKFMKAFKDGEHKGKRLTASSIWQCIGLLSRLAPSSTRRTDMALVFNGLAKLVEECGELCQIAAKKMNYPDTDDHPDGKGSMKQRLEEEIADVHAAMVIVIEQYELDDIAIATRASRKERLFHKWIEEN